MEQVKKAKQQPKKLIDLVIGGEEFSTLEIPKRKMIIEEILPEKALAMDYASRGEGKTWFNLQLAISVAEGSKFLAWEVPAPAGVLYIDGEMALKDIQDRIRLLSGGKIPSGLMILPSEWTFEAQTPLNIASINSQLLIDSLLTDLKSQGKDPRLIIFDNLSSLSSGIEENSNSEQEKYLHWFIDLKHRGYTVVLVHHAGKGKEFHSPRGASRMEDFMELSIRLAKVKKESQDNKLTMTLEFMKNRGRDPEPNKPKFILTTEGDKAVWSLNGSSDTPSIHDYLKLLQDNNFQNQKELAKKLKVTPSAVSQNLKKLREDGLVTEKGLELTEAGRDKLSALLSGN